MGLFEQAIEIFSREEQFKQFETTPITELLMRRTLYKKAYYIGESIATDSEYDILNLFLESKGHYEKVGVDYLAKAKHNIMMLSLKKVNLDEEHIFPKSDYDDIIKHFSSHSEYNKDMLFSWEWKNDGISSSAKYMNGKLYQIVTRGTGHAGDDITTKFKHLFPQNIDKRIAELRCEIIIKDSVFQAKYQEDFSNNRGFVSGVKGDDSIDDERKYDCVACINDIVIVDADNTPYITSYSNAIKEYNIELPLSMIVNKARVCKQEYSAFVDMFNYFDSERKNIDIPQDGVVIKMSTQSKLEIRNDHDPYSAIAVKFKAKEFVGIVTDIIWNHNKSGQLRPIVLFGGVVIDGRTMTRADGYNIAWIRERNIGIGSKIVVEVRGEIISAIASVLESTTFDENCIPQDIETEERGRFLYYVDEKKKAEYNFIRGCEILSFYGFGASAFSKLSSICDNNIENIFDDTFVNTTTLATIFGAKSVQSFLSQLTEKKNFGFDILDCIKMLSIKGVSEKCATQVARHYSKLDVNMYNIVSKDFKDATEGISAKRLDSLLERLASHEIMVRYMQDKKENQKDITLDNKTKIVMTGSPKSFGFISKGVFLSELGDNYHDNKKVVKSCDYVVTDNINSTTGKAKDALKYEKPLVSYAEMLQLAKGHNIIRSVDFME